MSTIDPTERIDLTGLWAGFGFQGGHMFTPEGHHLEVQDMIWWSLTCNIAREWRLMMAIPVVLMWSWSVGLAFVIGSARGS